MRIEKGGVAFFDSGIGGLTVVNVCRKWLPNTLFYYYGDNKHAPYGNLPPEKIKKYVFRVFRRFEKMQVGAAVVACNTATAVCIDELRARFKFPIIGAEPALLLGAKNGVDVLVLITRATYDSERLRKLRDKVEAVYPSVRLKLSPCDKLAGEIEAHIYEKGYDYTSFLPAYSPDVVVLGCTHYVYIAKQIQDFYRCPVVDGNEGIAKRLISVFREENYLNEHLRPPGDHKRPNIDQVRPFEDKFVEKCKEKKGRERERGILFGVKKEKSIIPSKQKRLREVVFLGKDKKWNKSIYEHLFL